MRRSQAPSPERSRRTARRVARVPTHLGTSRSRSRHDLADPLERRGSGDSLEQDVERLGDAVAAYVRNVAVPVVGVGTVASGDGDDVAAQSLGDALLVLVVISEPPASPLER